MQPQQTNANRKPNALINQTSPYLLQHAYNPVNWQPWGTEALAQAQQENKLLLISIGYSACHWCHVMEKESFEDPEVAALMNAHFVCIKVDREERPDIDQIYMDAVQLMRQSGGWPLNCFALPNGKPIYGGTYFPKENWMALCSQIAAYYQKEPLKAAEYADDLTRAIAQMETIDQKTAPKTQYTFDDIARLYIPWAQELDLSYGGTRRAPKFPMPNNFLFLLRYAYFSKDSSARHALQLTLEKMAMGGIYDQIGGGFARYSVDEYWLVPHFEKMLYDNAQLIELYAEAYRWLQIPLYKQVVIESADFVLAELTDVNGGFYAALDADSEGEEGKYYIWTQSEINEILGEEKATLVSVYYNILPSGNWEHGRNILHRTRSDETLAKLLHISVETLQSEIKIAKQLLLAAREKRVKPGLDDKILTGWNGLMVKGLLSAYRATGEKRYLDAAITNQDFIFKNLYTEGKLLRTYSKGKAHINANLEDYANTIGAQIALYQVTFNPNYLLQAKKLLEYTLIHFWDSESGLFYFTSDEDPPLIARKMELYDNVIPSSNGFMAHYLLTLGIYFENAQWREMAAGLMSSVLTQVKGMRVAINAASNYGLLLMRFAFPDYEVACCGFENLTALQQSIDEVYHPHLLLAAGQIADEHVPLLSPARFSNTHTPQIFVCKNQTCFAPVTTVEQMRSLMHY